MTAIKTTNEHKKIPPILKVKLNRVVFVNDETVSFLNRKRLVRLSALKTVLGCYFTGLVVVFLRLQTLQLHILPSVKFADCADKFSKVFFASMLTSRKKVEFVSIICFVDKLCR